MSTQRTASHPDQWPETARYRGDQLSRIALPVGGIGTGAIGFGGRGQFLDWEIFGRPAKGFSPRTFAAISVAPVASGQAGHQGDGRVSRVLEGPLTALERWGADGSRSPAAGLPRFSEAEFIAGYPFGRVRLTDPELPIDVTVGAFNPLVPGDSDASGWPVAVYRVGVRNPGAVSQQVSVALSVRNPLGAGADGQLPDAAPVLRHQRLDGADVLVASGPPESPLESAGTLAVAAVGGASSRTGYWRRFAGFSYDLLEFWDEFAGTGQVSEPALAGGCEPAPTGTVVITRDVPPGGESVLEFVIAWHVPQRRVWGDSDAVAAEPVGNYYAGLGADAAAVLARFLPQLPQLETATTEFVTGVVGGGVPRVVADAALSSLAVLRSPTCFRIGDGRFYGWEGVWDGSGSCFGNCTHVWNYQYAVEDLFGDLAWSMRRTEFVDSLDDAGLMSFRAALPPSRGTAWRVAAADGQWGSVVRLLRTWRTTGDDAQLRELWPGVRRALEYSWQPGGWDADRDGLMEGCQHNTMDVEYYGPSGYVQSWYLGGLAAAAQLAEAVGDNDCANTCRRLLAAGAAATDRELFTGEYYAQRVIRPDGEPAAGVRDPRNHVAELDPGDGTEPEVLRQLGSGCGADQLAGVYQAQLSGLSVPLAAGNLAAAIDAVLRYNWLPDAGRRPNDRRSYASSGDSGLVNASYPNGNRPAHPFPYWAETWTGIEYTAAIGLALQGRLADAEQVVAAVRARHDGRARNPFSEPECGHHYARSMAAWGLLAAWQHQHRSAPAHGGGNADSAASAAGSSG
ncbi:GH116 family glycosyl-hydrolase [Nakamurella aerolata]|uniref:Uncharacterized protein n=1 Tax=Nakamurella aerolata TaxID=1656892 RepID=A0A849A4V4_9ACTN|nr:GH116 family glycosyl-hydrolase [Nakamurella aerolata]NNG35575.1 hypothetical protein [Nakamurella aerolata]